jgi:hypothetical protein
MAENLTKSLVDLSGFGLAPEGNSELGFDRVESDFDVRAFGIGRHEILVTEPTVDAAVTLPFSRFGRHWMKQ